MVESGVIQDDSDLIVICFACQASHPQDDLLGVLVALDGIDPHRLGGQAQGAEEGLSQARAVDVDLGALALGQPHAADLGLVLHTDLIDRVHLPAAGQQACDLGADLRHPLRDGLLIAALVEGVGQLEAHAGEAQEQLVGGVRLVLHAEPCAWPRPTGRGRLRSRPGCRTAMVAGSGLP